jgi:hypothetical protein
LAPFQTPGTQQGTLGVGINGFGVIDVRTTCTDTPNPPADCAFEGTFPINVNVLGRVGGTYYAERMATHTVSGGTRTAPLRDLIIRARITYDPNLVVHGLSVTP